MTPSRPERTVAVVGTPNTGKSTLFNALTGLQQRVGNFPGVTVEPMIGAVHDTHRSVRLIDLPGTYGLTPTSEDERLTVEVLRGTHPTIPQPDAVLFVMNADDPEKSLFLLSYIMELGLPAGVAATMVDEVKVHGGAFDDIGLMHRLGIPILPVVGHKGLGIGDVRDAVLDPAGMRVPAPMLQTDADIDARFAWARTIVTELVRYGVRDPRTERLDRILLHPVWGGVVFFAVMALFFQSIFTWATPLMDGIDGMMSWLQDHVDASIGNDMLRSFISKGLLAGVGSVIVFLPQILILNLFVTFLEECGYLSRAAFIVDRAMGLFGLQGRSFIPLLGSFACAIPGIMSARIIPSYKDRMATILATPLMTCSARLPVYALLISAVIPAGTVWGFVAVQGLVLGGLYVLGALSGLLIALFLKRTFFRGGVVPFLIEFPPYRMPSLQSMGVTMVGRAKDFLTTAGTVILGFSIALWILTELPRTDAPAGMSDLQVQQHQLEHSFAADIGKTIQPVFAPLGFDWKVTLGILGSFAARETFVGVMGQIYAADVSESDSSLRDVLHATMPLATGLSILAFYVYALQCISTMAIMKRETGSWKWPSLAFGMTFVLAYGAALAVRFVFS
jgi:ferrous iron transport protein B